MPVRVGYVEDKAAIGRHRASKGRCQQAAQTVVVVVRHCLSHHRSPSGSAKAIPTAIGRISEGTEA